MFKFLPPQLYFNYSINCLKSQYLWHVFLRWEIVV